MVQGIFSNPTEWDKTPIYEKLENAHSMGDDTSISTFSNMYFNYIIYTDFGEGTVPLLQKDVKQFFDYLYKVSEKNKTDFTLQIGLLRFNSIYYVFSKEEASSHTMEILDRAFKLEPNNPEPYWWLAQVYFWKGDNSKAVDAYKKGIAINPNLDVSHNMLIKFAKDTNNNKLYEESLSQAVKDIPDFKPYSY